jgi:hypothetical protein
MSENDRPAATQSGEPKAEVQYLGQPAEAEGFNLYQQGFLAGQESRQPEINRLNEVVTLAYRGAECVRPRYHAERVGDAIKSVRENCGVCWGCQLAKAAARVRGLK